MERYIKSGGAAAAPAPDAGATPDYPTTGNAGTGTPASVPGAYWYHMMAEEMRKAIVDAGQVPSATDLSQLSAAIHPIDQVTGVQYRIVVINGTIGLEAI